MPSFSEFLFGKKDKLKKVPTGTPQQQQFHGNILNQLMQMQQQGGGYNNAQNYYNSLLQPGNEAYQNFAAPYLQNFEEQILPGIAEQYAGKGALSSSAFGQSLGAAGAGLQSQLARLFAELQSQAAGAQTNQFNQLGQFGLNYQPFAYENKQGSGGLLGPLATGAATAFGGPLAGLAAGGIASLFKKKPQTASPLTNTYDALFRSGALT